MSLMSLIKMIFARFEIETGSKTIGFGIEGDWISEYVPSPDADFYFIENGVKVTCFEFSEKERCIIYYYTYSNRASA